MLADRMQEHAQQKETFHPLPTPYHMHPLFFAKESHPLFPEICLIRRIQILRCVSQVE